MSHKKAAPAATASTLNRKGKKAKKRKPEPMPLPLTPSQRAEEREKMKLLAQKKKSESQISGEKSNFIQFKKGWRNQKPRYSDRLPHVIWIGRCFANVGPSRIK